MKTCDIRACGKRTRAIDADGFCEECQALAVKFRAKIAAGLSIKPDYDARIGERISTIPAPRADLPCSACERPFTSLDDQEQELGREAKPLYLHRRCREILDCL